jgi:hypothetical protein
MRILVCGLPQSTYPVFLQHTHWISPSERGSLGLYACSGCSVMFLNPEQFSALGSAAPNIEFPTVVSP